MKPVGLTPEDFKMLPKDGARFEALVCQLLEAMGYHILERPAVGTEGGRDVLVERVTRDAMIERREKVVVQCKHYARGGKAVGDSVVGVWQNAMTRYKARGYLLVTDTRVTENLSRSFREFTEDEMNFPKWAAFWDVDQLIRYLNEYPAVRDSFFPSESIIPMAPQDLATEVQTWLQAIRYKVEDSRELDDRITSMVATMDEGTVKQSVRVHCVSGEITLSDAQTLESALDLKMPQGWLISDKRISQKARQSVTAEESHIQVFDLAGFLEEKIWGSYFGQLRTLAEESQIPELYVDLGCYKKEMDETGHEVGQDRHASLDAYIDDWLLERGKMHISLLGEFGAGKTWFCRHYAYRQLERYLNDPANERLPLLITLRAFTKAMTAQQLINDALLEQYKLPFVGSAFEIFQEMNRRGKLLLILDGFDEMARQVDYQTVVDNFWELAKLVGEGSKVVLTSRTEYFRWAKESEKILGGEEFGRRTIVLSPPKFEVLHLEPFSNNQIRAVIAQRLGTEDGASVAERILESPNLAEMARKPILVELLLTALDEVSANVLENPPQVYLYATNRLLLRNIDTQRTFTTTTDKLYFLCELAWEMIKSGRLRIHYTDIPERIQTYFGDQIKDQHELDMWDYDLRNQTLLHRNAAGYYEFAHKSLAEYLVAFKFAAELGCLAPMFTQTYCEADGKLCKVPIEQKDVPELANSFGAMALTEERMHAVHDLLQEMITKEEAVRRLWEIIYKTRERSPEQVKYTGGNAATLLRTQGASFKGRQLSRTVLTGADLSMTNLTGTDLRSVCLREATLSGCTLESTNMHEVDLTNVRIEEMGEVFSVAWSPNGKALACGGNDGVVRLWIDKYRANPMEISCNTTIYAVEFTPGGSQLAWCEKSGVVHIRDVFGEKIVTIESLPARGQLAHSPDGNWLAAAMGRKDIDVRIPDWLRDIGIPPEEVTAGSQIQLWNLASGRSSTTLESRAGYVDAIAFSPNGSQFASGGSDGMVQLWDVPSFNPLKVLRVGSNVTSIAYSPNGEQLAVGTYRQAPQIWDISTCELLKVLEVREAESGVPFSFAVTYRPNGDQLAVVAPNGQHIHIWDVGTGRLLQILKGHRAYVYDMDYSPDGRFLASGGADSTVRIWDVNADNPMFGRCLRILEVQMNCQGMQINRARGLEQNMNWTVQGEKREGTLLEFFADHGAVLDKVQKRLVAEAHERCGTKDRTKRQTP